VQIVITLQRMEPSTEPREWTCLRNEANLAASTILMFTLDYDN